MIKPEMIQSKTDSNAPAHVNVVEPIPETEPMETIQINKTARSHDNGGKASTNVVGNIIKFICFPNYDLGKNRSVPDMQRKPVMRKISDCSSSSDNSAHCIDKDSESFTDTKPNQLHTEEDFLHILKSRDIAGIVEAMRSNLSSRIIAMEACHALRNLSRRKEPSGLFFWRNNNNQDFIREAGAIPTILSAIEEHSLDTNVQKWACGALAHLSCGNLKNKNSIVDAGAIPIIVSVLKRNIEHPIVLEQGCLALWSLSSSENQSDVLEGFARRNDFHGACKIRKAGGINAINIAKAKHPSEYSLQVCANAALDRLLT